MCVGFHGAELAVLGEEYAAERQHAVQPPAFRLKVVLVPDMPHGTHLGLIIGLVGGLGAGRWMSGYLFGVSAADAASIAGVVAVLVLVAWASALWPAYRASTIDPSVVLRDS